MAREHIQTNFMDRQAAENAKSGTARGIFMGIGLVALIGIGFGATQVFQYFSNFESNQFKRNVAVTLKEPKVAGGKALVSVEIKNHNAVEISTPVIKYSISSRENQALASGEVKIDGTIPAADNRIFEQVTLAEVNGQPARLQSDLIHITVGSDKDLPKGFPARFAGAFEKNGAERIAALEALANEVPNFESGHIALGLAYEEEQNWSKALEHFKQAMQINPSSSNAHYHYGLALAHEKKMSEAIAELKKAAELNPSDAAISKALTALTAKPGSAPALTADTTDDTASEEE